MSLPLPESGKDRNGARGIAGRPARVEADVGGRGPAETAPSSGQPWLQLEVADVSAILHAAAPTLTFTLEIEDRSEREVFMAALSVMIQIEPVKRSYAPEERDRLAELFGDSHRWSTSAQRMMWSTESVLVTAFKGRTTVEMPVLCNYDLELAATRYFHAVDGGMVPLAFHFNGSVYYEAEDGGLQITQIPWDTAADFKLPLETWKGMIDAYYPYRGWLPLQRETLEAVRARKVARGLPTYDEAIRELLDEGEPDRDGGR